MTRRRNDAPTDAEIDRSQAMLAAVLGPDEVAKIDAEAAAIEAQLSKPPRLPAGIHFDIPEAVYRGDPCPEPSLTQSTAKVLIDRSPAHAWTQHCRLNPDFEPDDAKKYDVGNVAHRLLLGRGKEIVALDFKDWRTNAAKDAREAAKTAGRVGVLQCDYDAAAAIVEAARRQLAEVGWLADFETGASEVVVIASEGKTWLRSLVDRLVDTRVVYDLKTTGLSVAPTSIPGMMVNAGWPIQAAFQERILDHLDPDGSGRRKFRFIAVEDVPPYALTPVEFTEGTMTMGRKMVDAAVNLWRTCVETKLWPAYSTDVCRPEYPGWKENEWLEREVADAGHARRTGGMLPSLMGG